MIRKILDLCSRFCINRAGNLYVEFIRSVRDESNDSTIEPVNLRMFEGFVWWTRFAVAFMRRDANSRKVTYTIYDEVHGVPFVTRVVFLRMPNGTRRLAAIETDR